MAEIQASTSPLGGKKQEKKKKGKKPSSGGSSGGEERSIMKRLSIGKIYQRAGKKKEALAAAAALATSKEHLEEAPPQESVQPQPPEHQRERAASEETLSSEQNTEEPSNQPGTLTEESLEEDDEQDTGGPPSLQDATTSTGSDIEGGSGQSGVKRECLYKILVIGELGTGKTSIIKRYVHQFFSQHYRATIGVDFALKVLNWDHNTIIRLQLWDIAGQERFGNMTRVYYKEAVGAFIVFDVTRAATFDAVVKWKKDLDSKVQLPDGNPIPCVLLANKCDQKKEGIVNEKEKMNEYCDENNFTAWYETSAKENINIEEAANSLITQILKNDTSSENGRGSLKDPTKFPLDPNTDSSTNRKSCSC